MVGFWQAPNGDRSSGRLNASLVIYTGLICVYAAIYVGLQQGEHLNQLPQLLLMAGPALITAGLGFQGWHKSSESAQFQAEFNARSPIASMPTPPKPVAPIAQNEGH